MIKEAVLVIRGTQPRYTSCSLISQVSLFNISSLTFNGASKFKFFFLQVSASNLGSSKKYPL